MKPEEALKKLSYNSTAYGSKCTSEVMKVAVKAIKKQIPMKPKDTKIIRDFSGRYYNIKGKCPICGEENLYKSNYYCDKCGQRLEWKRGDIND